MGEQRKRIANAARRTIFATACAALTSACPPDSTSGGTEEQRGSKENAKSGAGNDRRSLQEISGAERGKKDPRAADRDRAPDRDREPGGR